MNELTSVIDELQSEIKVGIPKIVELLADSDSSVRSKAVGTIKTLGQQGKLDENGE
jgi:hypothetical protein